MEVREVAGGCGAMPHILPTVWSPDAKTLCILLENPKNDRWLVITLDLQEPHARRSSAGPSEVA